MNRHIGFSHYIVYKTIALFKIQDKLNERSMNNLLFAMETTTKTKILETATELFLKKGFFGTSISDIANIADINQSLIYYHIGNKEKLWKAVKESLIKESNIENDITKQSKDFESFIYNIITNRIQIYENDPRILRLIQWQMIENDEKLISNECNTPISWISSIKLFQDNNQVTKEYTAELIVVYIHSLVQGLLVDAFHIFKKNTQQREGYISMICDSIIKIFKKQGVTK